MHKTLPMWELERISHEKGFAVVCGCDEAGAGPLAGPVYAGAVVLPEGLELPYLNDSKKVTPKRRDLLFSQIQEQAVDWAVAFVTAGEIDATDILSARIKAMQLAIDALAVQPDYALIDGNRTGGSPLLLRRPMRPSWAAMGAAPASPPRPSWRRSAGTGTWKKWRKNIPSTALTNTRGMARNSTMPCWPNTGQAPSTG